MTSRPSQLLQKWDDARQRLDGAIQNYLGRTTELASDVYDPAQCSNNSDLLKKIILEAYGDSHSIPSRVDTLEKTQRMLIAIRNAPSPLVSINKLSPDILQYIFSLVANQNRYILHELDPVYHRTPDHGERLQSLLSLSHVCIRWRTIIINTPSLWAHVRIKFNRHGELTKTYDYLETCLERARDVPLRLAIDGDKSISNIGIEKLY